MFFLKISKVLHNPSPISPRQDRGMSQQCSNPVPLKLNILLLTEGLDDMSKVRHYWSTLHPAKVLTPRNIRFLLPFLFYNFSLHHFLRPYFIKLEYTEKPFLTLKVNKQGIWLNDVMSLSSSLDPLIPPLIEGLQMPVNKRSELTQASDTASGSYQARFSSIQSGGRHFGSTDFMLLLCLSHIVTRWAASPLCGTAIA